MRKLFLFTVLCALALPASASARIDALDPSVGGSAITAAQAIAANPSQVNTAALVDGAFGGAGAPSPIGVGNKLLDPEPKVLADFPTWGDTYGLLSSGQINTIASTLENVEEDTTFSFPSQFPSGIDRGPVANDYTVLAIDVTVPQSANCLALDYRFLSEEFPEFVNTEYNDAFIAEVDSTTWRVEAGGAISRPNDFAVSPGGNPISINGLGETAVSAEEAAGTYFDAATGLITTKTPITPGHHVIYLSIFDASDSAWDSAAFVDNLRFVAESAATCQPPTGQALAVPQQTGQQGTTTPPPAPPSNQFTLGSSVKFKNGGTKATLSVTVPGPGVVSASSTAAAAAAAKKKPKKRLLAPASVRATKPGVVKLTLKLSKTGKKVLAKRGKVTLRVKITFTPTGGTASTQTKKLTFKKPKRK
jgi:hypothetical protein